MNTRTKWLQGHTNDIWDNPTTKYTPEEKRKNVLVNQPPLGLMTGNYYKMKVYLLAEITAL